MLHIAPKDLQNKNAFQSLQWRQERKADQAADFKVNPFFTENYPYQFAGTNKLGHPGQFKPCIFPQ